MSPHQQHSVPQAQTDSDALRKKCEDLEAKVKAQAQELSLLTGQRQHVMAECDRLTRALRESQTKYQTLFFASTDAILLGNLDGDLVECNAAACQLFGYDQQEMLALNVRDLVNESDWARFQTLKNAALLNGGMLIDAAGKKKKGTIFLSQFNVQSVTLDSETFLLIYARDMSEWKKAELALYRRQLELESLLETSRDLSGVLDLDELLRLIVLRAKKLLEADECTLFLLLEDEEILKPLISLSEYEDELMALRIQVGEGITGKAVQQGKPIMANNAHEDPRAMQIDNTPFDIEHIMASPLIFRGHTKGAMHVNRVGRSPFIQEELNLFAAFSLQAAAALENAQLYEQAQRHASELETRVAERTEELEIANAYLTKLGQIKDEFISNISHELRTPITNLKIYHELMTVNPGGVMRYLPTLRRETERLEHIIEGVLYLSRLEQLHVDFKPCEADLNKLAEEYVVDRAQLARSHGLQLVFTETEGLPLVKIDRMMLGQALSILLTNAMDYTPEGGVVSVSTSSKSSSDREWAGLTVSDTGPGVQMEDQNRIFERFYRGQVGRDSGKPGIGLGLSIARQVVSQHAGNIQLESSGISGEGASFTIWLPAI